MSCASCLADDSVAWVRQHYPEVELGQASDEHLPMEREQVHVFLGHAGIRRRDPDFYKLSVMDH